MKNSSFENSSSSFYNCLSSKVSGVLVVVNVLGFAVSELGLGSEDPSAGWAPVMRLAPLQRAP